MPAFTLAHLSDLHATPVRASDLPHPGLRAKQVLGFLSWLARRRHEHRPDVLARLLDDLREADPDHVVLTGDLTNLGLPAEIEAARAWLERIGDPAALSLVPGNHDAYGAAAHAPWAPWIASDAGLDAASRPVAGLYPSLRFRGPLALVGLSSARPGSLLAADGALGAAQRDWLEATLAALGDAGWCRVVLLHHPPLDLDLHARRRLRDGAALRAVLARTGAELVLHGHTHRTSVASIDGPAAAIPVVGVRSASARGRRRGRSAQYHLYRIERAAGARRWRIAVSVRAFDAARGTVVDGERYALP
jgi:3',5'-cyclic AMP phosphodiesterase CpdA